MLNARLIPHYNSVRTAFLCCDIQEAFRHTIPRFAECASVAARFSVLSTLLPADRSIFIAAEQNPKKLGSTAPSIPIPPTGKVISKMSYSMVPVIAKDIEQYAICVLFGIETHACVLQSTVELLDAGKKVVLAVDGCDSQRPLEHNSAMDYLRSLQVSTNGQLLMLPSEGIVLQMLRTAEDPLFRDVLKGIKNIS